MKNVAVALLNANSKKLCNILSVHKEYQVVCVCDFDNALWDDGNIPVCSFGKATQMYKQGTIDMFVISSGAEYENNSCFHTLITFGVSENHIYYAPLELFVQDGTNSKNANELLCEYQKRTELETMEIHLTEHCNLNCKYCSMFCGLVSEPEFLNFEEFSLGMYQLKHYFTHIKRFRIIGGEPLLNKKINNYIDLIRELYPYTHIRLLTNGILLNSMPNEFYDCIKKNNVCLVITYYPVLLDSVDTWNKLLKEKDVYYEITPPVTDFLKIYDATGRNNYKEQFRKCHWKGFCATMYGTKISTCFVPFVIHHLFDNFNIQHETCGTIDLLEPELTTEMIRSRFNEPFELCKFCSFDKKTVQWERCDSSSRFNIKDWSV